MRSVPGLLSCHSISDLRRKARRRAHRMVFDYIDGGAEDEHSLRRSCDAFGDYELLFRTLVGVEGVDTSTTVLGQKIAHPFFPSPSAGNRLFHTDGERAVAKAAAAYELVYCLSTLSTVSIEEITKLTPGPKWFQCYVWRDRGLIKEMLDRARAAGFTALILTVDLPVHGNRLRDIRNGFTIPPRIGLRQAWEALKRPAWTWDYLTTSSIKYAHLSQDTAAVNLAEFVSKQLDASFSWRDAEWLLDQWRGVSAIKGIIRPDDAKRAVATGFKGVFVSTHGGRQLDRTPAPIDMLEEIVQAVGADAEVILDGGVRRGTDVLTALALGAKAVSFGRPYLYGLAAAGEAGVRRAFEILANEVRRDMALLGARNVAEIDLTCVRQRPRTCA